MASHLATCQIVSVSIVHKCQKIVLLQRNYCICTTIDCDHGPLQMGLGKTAQSIAVLEYARQLLGKQGPFLVIAPLTTLGHWAREIETWTTMVTHCQSTTGEFPSNLPVHALYVALQSCFALEPDSRLHFMGPRPI